MNDYCLELVRDTRLLSLLGGALAIVIAGVGGLLSGVRHILLVPALIVGLPLLGGIVWGVVAYGALFLCETAGIVSHDSVDRRARFDEARLRLIAFPIYQMRSREGERVLNGKAWPASCQYVPRNRWRKRIGMLTWWTIVAAATIAALAKLS